MSGQSPTSRTLQALKEQGCSVCVVERWNQFAGPHGIRQDAFGCFDLLCITPLVGTMPHGIVGVQCCARSSHAAHRTKIIGIPEARLWLSAGGRIEIWSWAKQKVKRGGKAVRWTPKVEEITVASFEAAIDGEPTTADAVNKEVE